MGYCNGDCSSLNSIRHKCNKYHKPLAYMKQSGRGTMGFCVHEQCNECQKDKWIETLENKLKCNDVNKECLYMDCKNCK
jgi:hypothetical protein